MSNTKSQLAAQRAALINQVAFQRIELAESFETVVKPIKFIDQGWFALRYLTKHPLILVGSLALAVAVRPNRWVQLLESGWMAWKIAMAAKRRFAKKTNDD